MGTRCRKSFKKLGRMKFRDSHLTEFKACFAEACQRKFVDESSGWAGGKFASYTQHLKTIGSKIHRDFDNINGSDVSDRTALRTFLSQSEDPIERLTAILVWGGMRPHHFGSLAAQIGTDDHRFRILNEVVHEMGQGKLTAVESYDRFASLAWAGMGPAYFTKLIHFLTPLAIAPRGLIMDQWTGKSANLLHEGNVVVKMDGHRVSPRNNSTNYELFCRLCHNLASQLHADVDDIEMVMFGIGRKKRNPSRWRMYLERHYPKQ